MALRGYSAHGDSWRNSAPRAIGAAAARAARRIRPQNGDDAFEPAADPVRGRRPQFLHSRLAVLGWNDELSQRRQDPGIEPPAGHASPMHALTPYDPLAKACEVGSGHPLRLGSPRWRCE